MPSGSSWVGDRWTGRERATSAATRIDACSLPLHTDSHPGNERRPGPMHSVGSRRLVVRGSPMTDSATSSGLARNGHRRPEPGCRPHRARGRRVRPGRLAPAATSTRSRRRLYVLAGELVLDIGGAVHRLVAGDYALHPDRDMARPRQRRRPSRSAGCRSTRRSACGPMRDARTRSSDRSRSTLAALIAQAVTTAVRRPQPSVRRPLRRHAAPGRGACRRRSGARPQAGWDGHGAPGLQRDLGEDARSTGSSGRTC